MHCARPTTVQFQCRHSDARRFVSLSPGSDEQPAVRREPTAAGTVQISAAHLSAAGNAHCIRVTERNGTESADQSGVADKDWLVAMSI